MAFFWFKARNRIQRYHRTMISRHGLESTYALGWRHETDQVVRFETLARIANLNGHTVLDAGCGYADLYPFLKQRYPGLAGYTGIEQIPELLAKAKNRFPQLDIKQGDFIRNDLPVCDYVFASGSLNYDTGEKDYIFLAIKTLYQASRIGLGFNLLRKLLGKGALMAYDPAVILAYCQSLCPNVVFIDGYADEDFTMFMYRIA